MGDHRVDLDLAVHVPIDDPRHIGAPARAAEGCTAPAPSGDELEGPSGDLRTCWRDANDDAFAPTFVASFQRGAHDLHIAGRIEGVVRAAAGELHQMADQIAFDFSGVHKIGHAEFLRHLDLSWIDIDTDDLIRAGEAETLDHVQADPAEAKDNRPAADLGLGSIDHRANAGGHTTTNVTNLIERCVLADLGQ